MEKQASRGKIMVRWASKVQLRFTQKSDSQRLESWYTNKDYKSFKRDCKITIAMAGSGDTPTNEEGVDSLCIRGPEALGADKERAHLRREQRQDALEAVADSQYDSSGEFWVEEDDIAEAYRIVSERSQTDAHLQALQYSEENKREGLTRLSSISRVGRSTKAAFHSSGGSMRKLWKKTLSIRHLGKRSSLRASV